MQQGRQRHYGVVARLGGKATEVKEEEGVNSEAVLCERKGSETHKRRDTGQRAGRPTQHKGAETLTERNREGEVASEYNNATEPSGQLTLN